MKIFKTVFSLFHSILKSAEKAYGALQVWSDRVKYCNRARVYIWSILPLFNNIIMISSAFPFVARTPCQFSSHPAHSSLLVAGRLRAINRWSSSTSELSTRSIVWNSSNCLPLPSHPTRYVLYYPHWITCTSTTNNIPSSVFNIILHFTHAYFITDTSAS